MNNDGNLGKKSAWERQKGTFTRVDDFDWEAYADGSAKPKETKVKIEHLRELFDNGALWLEKSEAAKRLQGIAKVGRTAAYDALKLIAGRFSELLRQRDDGLIGILAD